MIALPSIAKAICSCTVRVVLTSHVTRNDHFHWLDLQGLAAWNRLSNFCKGSYARRSHCTCMLAGWFVWTRKDIIRRLDASATHHCRQDYRMNQACRVASIIARPIRSLVTIPMATIHACTQAHTPHRIGRHVEARHLLLAPLARSGR